MLEIRLEKVRGRYALLRHLFSFYSPLSIAALWFPIRATQPIARSLAGHHTDLRVSIAVSFIATATISLGGVALLVKNRAQSKELRRLRERIQELENR